VGQGQDGGDDRLVVLVLTEAVDEGAVDLQVVDREALQAGE
jgi:hypothetical protein